MKRSNWTARRLDAVIDAVHAMLGQAGMVYGNPDVRRKDLEAGLRCLQQERKGRP